MTTVYESVQSQAGLRLAGSMIKRLQADLLQFRISDACSVAYDDLDKSDPAGRQLESVTTARLPSKFLDLDGAAWLGFLEQPRNLV